MNKNTPAKKEALKSASEAKIRAALTLYFAMGGLRRCAKEVGVPKSTLHDWVRTYTEWVADAKETARAIRMDKVIEIINKVEFRINGKLDSKADIPFNQLVVAGGIFLDKYMKLAGIAEKREVEGTIKHDHSVKVFERFIELKEKAKQELNGDSNNRIKSIN